MNRYMKTLLLILISLSILSCQSVPPLEPLTHKNSNLTHGNVQMHIAPGVTTKAQILGSAIFLREASQ